MKFSLSDSTLSLFITPAVRYKFVLEMKGSWILYGIVAFATVTIVSGSKKANEGCKGSTFRATCSKLRPCCKFSTPGYVHDCVRSNTTAGRGMSRCETCHQLNTWIPHKITNCGHGLMPCCNSSICTPRNETGVPGHICMPPGAMSGAQPCLVIPTCLCPGALEKCSQYKKPCCQSTDTKYVNICLYSKCAACEKGNLDACISANRPKM